MVNTNLNLHILTHTAIHALKNAYEKCTDIAVKEYIASASKTVLQLHYGIAHDDAGECGESTSDCDPSEYCAAV